MVILLGVACPNGIQDMRLDLADVALRILDEIALSVMNADVDKRPKLRLCFYAFGDHGHVGEAAEIIQAFDEQFLVGMQDPTRGGLATALCEISESHHIGALIEEDQLHIRPAVGAVHELLGTDPLYFSSEGRMILVIEKGYGMEIVNVLKCLESCRDAELIGTFNKAYSKVCIRTPLGGERILSMLENQMISRIC